MHSSLSSGAKHCDLLTPPRAEVPRGLEAELQHVVTPVFFGPSRNPVFFLFFCFNWPCSRPQLGFITGEESSIEELRATQYLVVVS